MGKVRIQTAQNVDIEYEVASVGDRILAYLIDVAIIIIYIMLVSLLFFLGSKVLGDQVPPAGVIGLMVVLCLPILLYDLLLELFMDGQSFGKRQRQIKVVKLDGSQPGIGSYLLRWLLRLIDLTMFSGGVALITILINGKGQRLGDIAAGTAVVKLKQRATLDGTIFVEVGADYIPVFPLVAGLDAGAIATVKEVLQTTARQGKRGMDDPEQLLAKTKEVLEGALGLSSELPPRDFLTTVIKDYNALHGDRQ